MAKFKLSGDVVNNIGGLLLSLVPELIKLFGKKRDGSGKLGGALPGLLKTALSGLTPLATVKPDEIRRVAKLFELLGGKPDGSGGETRFYTGGVLREIADVLLAFKANGAAGKSADDHLDKTAMHARTAASELALLASELFTVADVWGM